MKVIEISNGDFYRGLKSYYLKWQLYAVSLKFLYVLECIGI